MAPRGTWDGNYTRALTAHLPTTLIPSLRNLPSTHQANVQPTYYYILYIQAKDWVFFSFNSEWFDQRENFLTYEVSFSEMQPLPMSDADASSRLRSGIMTPSSEGSLQHNGHSSATPDSRKRKRERSLATDHLLRPPIDLKVCLQNYVESPIKVITNTYQALPSEPSRPTAYSAPFDASSPPMCTSRLL